MVVGWDRRFIQTIEPLLASVLIGLDINELVPRRRCIGCRCCVGRLGCHCQRLGVSAGAADLDGVSAGADLDEVGAGAGGAEDFALMALGSNVTDRFFGLES